MHERNMQNTSMDNDDTLIDIKGLKTHFFLDDGVVKAVDGVDFSIRRGKTLCVVGESGCGKSIMARSIMRIVADPGRTVAGSIEYYHADGSTTDLATLDPRGAEIRQMRGKEITMIFQEPMSSLSPVHTIGNQIIEPIMLHLGMNKKEAQKRAVELLDRVGIPKPETRLDAYPFQLSGGMRQRAMIAMALSCEPRLLIADEPTTALDVTTQAQILDLIYELQEEFGMAVMFITHDLGVVAEVADEVVVMYLGVVAERGGVDAVFHDPLHPYTRALLKSIPKLGIERRPRLDSIRGMIPEPLKRPPACPFHSRCDSYMPGICDVEMPPFETVDGDRTVRCWLHSDHSHLTQRANQTPQEQSHE